ncbi:MAG: ABC transporter ATP-binding protein [Ruminiclostridium sp.]
MTENKEKISIGRTIQNIGYVLGLIARKDKWIVIKYMLAYTVFILGNVAYDTIMIKRVIDQLTDSTPLSEILVTIGLMFGLLAVSIFVMNKVENAVFTKAVGITGEIQREFYAKSARMDLSSYDDPKFYDSFVLAAQESDTMISSALENSALLVGNAAGILLSGGLIFTINPIIAIFPVAGFVINIVTRFAITRLENDFDLDKKKINRKSDYSRRVFYQPEYAKEIKLTGVAQPLKIQFEESIEEERQAARKYGVKIAWLSLCNWVFVFTFLSYFCVPAALAYMAIVKKTIRLGDVASMENAANAVRGLLDDINYILVELQRVGLFAERFRRFEEAEENIETAKGIDDVPRHGVLEIKNMSYKYDGAENYTLKNINMTVKAGEHIAIVGENGAGKTTLIKLLMRLYDVTEGEITFGGRDIREFTTSAYRNRISAVFQDYQMYATSLANNVAMEKNSPYTEEDITKALGRADFTARLGKMKKGLETEIMREFDEEGTLLSGGEAQKVAVARMFLKNGAPAISILDEPSSALDPVAEYTLNTNMMANAGDSTIIFISHRLSTTRDADRIYMFAHGEIVEQGTHEELMALNGEYKNMFEKQAHYYKQTVEEAV